MSEIEAEREGETKMERQIAGFESEGRREPEAERNPYGGYARFEIALDDSAYPKLLAQSSEPPARLYGYGDVESFEGGLAIVGARKATPYGLGCAAMFSGRAASAGITIVSGGAIGCDQAATRAAVDSGGRAVVVLAGGADVIYPARGRGLFCDVLAGHGAILSENPWGTAPLRYLFVKRNRVIAGLTQATLIVEAGLGSGTFSTAESALRDGREVLAVPGSINSNESRGSNRLIRDGATPIVDIESFDTALIGLFGVLPGRGIPDLFAPQTAGLSDDCARLVSALAANPMHVDALVPVMGMDVQDVARVLSECEAFGILERYRDGRWGVPVLPRVRRRTKEDAKEPGEGA